ncbi:hypothetical protein GCM10010442_39040 [Kitasatospora kifunensis]
MGSGIAALEPIETVLPPPEPPEEELHPVRNEGTARAPVAIRAPRSSERRENGCAIVSGAARVDCRFAAEGWAMAPPEGANETETNVSVQISPTAGECVKALGPTNLRPLRRRFGPRLILVAGDRPALLAAGALTCGVARARRQAAIAPGVAGVPPGGPARPS